MTKAQADVITTLEHGGRLFHDRNAQRVTLTWRGTHTAIHPKTLAALLRNGHITPYPGKAKNGVQWYMLATPPASAPE